MKLLQSIFLLLLITTGLRSQPFEPDTSLSDQQLIQSLMGPGVFIDNIQVNCDKLAISAFTGNVPGTGFQEGVIITTGNVFLTTNLINDPGAGYCSAAPGDPDISDMLNGRATYNGCAVEFDLIPTSSNVSLNYALASEEYPENTTREFADAFAILISGPGYSEPQNIALIPGTQIPVGITTVNPTTNNQYYYGSVANYMQYDGITRKFTANAAVTECEKYHFKIVIADAADCIFDSALLLEAGSLASEAGNTVVTYARTQESLLIEGCQDGVIRFCNAGALPEPYTLQLQLEGTAQNGLDYTGIPSSLLFTEQSQCHEIAIKPIQDGLVEGTETIRIIYTAVSGTCSKIDTITLSITDFQPINPAFVTNNVCEGDLAYFVNTTSIPESTIYRFTWDFGDNTGTSTYQNPEYLYPGPGNYTAKLVVRTNLGCSDSVSRAIKVVGRPTADFTFARGCLNSPVEFFNTSTSAPNSPGIEFYWNFGDGISSTATSPSHYYSSANDYTVSLISLSTELGCADTMRQAISIRGAPVAKFDFSNFCIGNLFEPVNLSTGDISSYKWDFGTGSDFSTAENPSFMYHQPGEYTVKLITANEDNCSDTASQQLRVYHQPSADFSIPLVCSGQSVLFSNTSEVNAPETISGSLWNFGDDSGELFSFHAIHTYENAGPVNVKLKVSTSQGCSDSITKTVNIHPAAIPRISVSALEGCTPLCLTLSETSEISGGNIISRRWLLSDLYESDQESFEHCFINGSPTQVQQFDISLSVTTDAGCESTLALKKHISVNPSPYPAFSFYPLTVYPHTRITLENLSSGDSLVKWHFGPQAVEVEQLYSSSPIIYFPEEGTFPISLSIENRHGCIASDTSFVTVLPFIQVHIPNAFSPGGDGINDIFKPVLTGCSEARLEIYSRNGELVFSETAESPAWDGYVSKMPAPDGVYFYRLYVTDHRGDHHFRQGNIMLLSN